MHDIRLMSGAGNRFAAFDNRIVQMPLHILSSASTALCHAPFADNLPAEGVIVLQKADGISKFDAVFFNPDGSTGAMCGNGARCAVIFALELKAVSSVHRIQFTMAGETYTAEFVSNGISVCFPPAYEITDNIKIEVLGKTVNTVYVNVGSEHAVFFYEDLKNIFLDFPDDFHTFDIETFAKPLRWHKRFAPRGVNINVAEKSLKNDNMLFLRTFERGVEGETGACGTGALATAITGVLHGIVASPITIYPKSNRPMTVRMNGGSPYSALTLEGDAVLHDAIKVKIANNGQTTFASRIDKIYR